MAEDVTLNKQYIIVLSPESAARDVLTRVLKKEGFKPHFIESPKQLTELVEKLKPATLLHDWPTIDLQLAIKFQQKLAKFPSYSNLCRIIYADTLTPGLAALAADCGIRRVISRATPPSSLVTEITMALTSLHQMPELQRLIHKIHNGNRYDQETIDQSIEKAYRYYAHDPLVRLEYANLLFRQKYFQNAKSLIKALLEENPNNVRATNLLARLLAQEGQLDSSASVLEAGNILSPYNIDRLVLLGDVFFALGNNSKSKSYYEQALELEPAGEKSAKAGLAQVHLSEGDVNTALEIINTSLSEEEAASLFNNAAVHAARTGRIEASLKLYRSTLKILKSPKLKATVYFNLAMAYERIGRRDDSLKAVSKSLELDPEHEKAMRQKQRLEKRSTKQAS